MKTSHTNKRASIGMKFVLGLILSLALALTIVIIVGKGYLFGKESAESLSLNPCTQEYSSTRLSEFKRNVEMYAYKTMPGESQTNEIYSPKDSITHYKIFLACKKNGNFATDQLATTGPQIETAVIEAYINLATDLCSQCIRSTNRKEKKDLSEEISILSDEFQDKFRTSSRRFPECNC